MPTPASKLSRQVFKKMLSGPKRYLPKAVSKELKAAGMSKLLYSNKISKQRAIKALRHLKEKKMITRLRPVSEIYRQAGLRQVKLDEQAHTVERQKHVRANIRIDVGEELSAEDRGELGANYDPRSVLGKRVIDQVDRERASREKKVQTERGKHEKLTRPNQARPNTKDIIQVETLPDMDIG